MTEVEAKTKWCPHREQIRLSLIDRIIRTSSDLNRLKTSRDKCCIASDCMMWVTEYMQNDGKLMLTQIANDIPDKNHRLATQGEIQEYDGCFEAGKPIFAYIQYATGHCGLINK